MKIRFTILVAIILSLVASLASQNVITAGQQSSLKTIGFIQGWSMHRLPLSDIKLQQLTHLTYSFVNVTSATDPTLYSSWGWSNITDCVSAGHANGTKVLVSLYGAADLDSILSSNQLRANLVANIKNMLLTYNVDGIDIDWEFGSGDSLQTKMDLFVTDLYNAIHPLNKIISVDPSGFGFPLGLNASKYVDIINCNLYSLFTVNDVAGFLNRWANAGYDKNKLILGIILDGKDSSDNWITTYADIINNLNPSPDQNQASITSINSSIYGSNTPVQGGILRWHGINLVKQKVDYVKANGFGGMMLFDVGQDKLNDTRSLLQTVYNELNSVSSNQAPVLAQIGSKTVTAGQLLSFTISGTDPDNNPLNYSVSNLPTGASFNAATLTFSWTPASNQTGSYPNVHFQVSDGTLFASENITITVSGVNQINQALMLNPIGNKRVNAGSLLSFFTTATGSNSNALIYSASNLPAGATFDASTHVFSWTPSSSQTGSYPDVHFQVSDGTLTASEDISIAVSNNQSLVLAAIGNKSVTARQSLVFTISAVDSSSNILTYSASNLPSGASFNAAARTFSWTPASNQAGNYPNVHFQVSNGTLTASEDITVAVNVVVMPANFSVNNLTLTPDSINLGQSTAVLATIGNSGTVTASYSATLMLESVPLETKEINIAGGKSQTVNFYLTPNRAGTLTLSVGNQARKLEVKEPVKAAFNIAGFSPVSTQIQPGKPVTISTRVTNTGNAQGTANVTFKVDGKSADVKRVVLGPGESADLTFTAVLNGLGTHNIDINGQTASFVVVAAAAETSPALSTVPVGNISANAVILPGEREFSLSLLAEIVAGAMALFAIIAGIILLQRRRIMRA